MANPSGMAALRNVVATSAIHNGARDEEDYTGVCHEGTREEYLKDLAMSADNAPVDRRLHWANAIAGAGKTAMLRTFCQLLEEKGHSFASFFIWKSDGKRNNLRHFPATIAHQLSCRITALVPHIERAFLQNPLVLESTFENQMLQLVINPLLNAADLVKELRHVIIVVDGLDELNLKAQTQFLNFIPNFLSRLSSLPISVLVSSRPEDMIVGAFEHPRLASITRTTRLGASDEDIWKFLNDTFEDMNLRFPYLRIKYDGKWPSDKQRAIMVKQSSGLFIWPTVALGHIDKVEKGLRHNERLEQVLSSADPKPWIASPLDNLYRAILEANALEDRESFAFFRFKQRLAYLCLPIGIGMFVWKIGGQVVGFSDTPARIVFDESLDELWSSVAGLSSLFSSRAPPSAGKSPTPAISHRSLRDFTFNRARCGDQLYYSSEQELHAEVVCKFFKFFNTRQAYQSCTEMNARFIHCVGDFLESHLKEATVSEELGHCMDDVMLEVIPPTWPLITQMYMIVKLFDGLYKLAQSPEFPDGSQRQKALLSKLVVFFKSRAARTAISDEWDIALFRLALSTANFTYIFSHHHHSVYCWHIARSRQCTCIDACMSNISCDGYQGVLGNSTLIQHAKSQLLPDGQEDVAQDSLVVLQFILSLSETSPQATELLSFIRVIDHWVIALLKHCPPNYDLYNILGCICTAPLPHLPKRAEDQSWELVTAFLWQTEEFNKYTKCCREAGIKTNFPPIKIPDDWWEDQRTRNDLLGDGYNPPFGIPDEWWEDRDTRDALLRRGYNPLSVIPRDWWEKEYVRNALLRGYKPPFAIPNDWWQNKSTRRLLRRSGYPPPDPYSAEETASESGSYASEDEEPAVQDASTLDHLVTGEDEPLAGGDAFSGTTLPQVLPSPGAASSNPLPIQPVISVHPMATTAVGAENGQVVPSNVGGRRRGFRAALRNLLLR